MHGALPRPDAGEARPRAMAVRRGGRGRLRRHALGDAMRDVNVAVYLVHSIGQGAGWEQAELDDATNFAARSRIRRRAAHRVPRRSRLRRRAAERAPRQPPRRRPGARVDGDRGRRAARRCDHRVGLGQFRDAALPRRAVAVHGDAPLGEHALPTHRHLRHRRAPRPRVHRSRGAGRRVRSRWARRLCPMRR